MYLHVRSTSPGYWWRRSKLHNREKPISKFQLTELLQVNRLLEIRYTKGNTVPRQTCQ